jgi:hypothetical protein
MSIPILHHIHDDFLWIGIIQLTQETQIFNSQQLIRWVREFGADDYLREFHRTSSIGSDRWRSLHRKIGARLVAFERRKQLRRTRRVREENIHGRLTSCQEWQRIA